MEKYLDYISKKKQNKLHILICLYWQKKHYTFKEETEMVPIKVKGRIGWIEAEWETNCSVCLVWFCFLIHVNILPVPFPQNAFSSMP